MRTDAAVDHCIAQRALHAAHGIRAAHVRNAHDSRRAAIGAATLGALRSGCDSRDAHDAKRSRRR
ncbi:hypothetical protein Y886_31215 [Xanthomonas hyacinthi DSM 19077]|nr:hypothetical protein Y886_31215 [Xanthomonas hyacinthi DSM 19077]